MKKMKFAVKSVEHSEVIQTKLFNLGYVWAACKNKTVTYTEEPYLFAHADGDITFSALKSTFNDSDFNDYEDCSETFVVIDEEVLKDQRLIWFEKFLNGVEVQFQFGEGIWEDLTWFGLRLLEDDSIQFREKPKFAVIDGFEFHSEDKLLEYIRKQYNLPKK